MIEVVINGEVYLNVDDGTNQCAMGKLRCAFNSNCHSQCFENKMIFHSMFILPEQKLDYITERLKS